MAMWPKCGPLLAALLLLQLWGASSSLPAAFAVRGQFSINEGAPNEATVTLPMVTLGASVSPFNGPSTAPTISVAKSALLLDWRLHSALNLTAPAPYTLLAIVDNPSVLASPVFSIPSTGLLSNTSSSSSFMPFNVSFPCATEGTASVSLVFLVGDPSKGQQIQATTYLRKACLPPSCAGRCVRGNCTGSVCECEARYQWNAFCDFGFWVDKAEVCPGEPFTVLWDFSNKTAAATATHLNDQIQIRYPNPATPFSSWTLSSINTAVLVSSASALYTSSFVKDVTAHPLPSGNFTYTIEEETFGSFALLYWPAGSVAATAVFSLSVLAKSDARCVPPVPDCTCSGHGYCSAQWNCVCDPGFFGDKCQHGCAPLTTLTAYGADVSSSVDKAAVFLNNANCTWLLQPNPALFPGVVGIQVLIVNMLSEVGFDQLTVYSGASHDSANLITTLSGALSTQVITVPGNKALLHFRSDSSFPSWPGRNAGFNLTFFALGCPAGSWIRRDETAGSWGCIKCPLGRFSVSQDSTSCTICDAGKFASVLGLTACESCPTGRHTNGGNTSSSCGLCPAGRFSEAQGTALCPECPAGTFSAAQGVTQCSNCDLSSYNPTAGNNFCLACPTNAKSLFQRATKLTDCVCEEGFYTFANSTGVACDACPFGAVCEGGLVRPKAKADFWFAPDEPLRMWQCALKETCPGGTSKQCVEGHTGKMCSVCDTGYSVGNDQRCKPCVNVGESAKLPLFMVGFLLLALGLLFIFTQRKEDVLLVKALLSDRSIMERHLLPGFATSFAISVTFVQIMGTFGRYTHAWPSSVSGAWGIFNIANMDLSLLSIECSVPIDYAFLFRIRMFIPFFLIAAFAALFVLQWVQYLFVLCFGRCCRRAFPRTAELYDEHKQWSLRLARARVLYSIPLGEENNKPLLTRLAHERARQLGATSSVPKQTPVSTRAGGRYRMDEPSVSQLSRAGVSLEMDNLGDVSVSGRGAKGNVVRVSPLPSPRRNANSFGNGVNSGRARGGVGAPFGGSSNAQTRHALPTATEVIQPVQVFTAPRKRPVPLRSPNSMQQPLSVPVNSRGTSSQPSTPLTPNTPSAMQPQTPTGVGVTFGSDRRAPANKFFGKPVGQQTSSAGTSDDARSDAKGADEESPRSVSSAKPNGVKASVSLDSGFADDTEAGGFNFAKDPEPKISLPRKVLFGLATEPVKVQLEACIVSLVFFMNLFYIYLVSSAVEIFDCYEQSDGTYTMTVHPSIDCYSSEWLELLPFSIFAMVFYGLGVMWRGSQAAVWIVRAIVIVLRLKWFVWCLATTGVPLWMYVVLRNYRRTKAVYMQEWTFFHHFPYHSAYRPPLYWWGLILLFRKLLLSIAVVSVTKDEGGKILVAFLVLFGSLYLQARYAPYKLVVHNNLEFRLITLCILVLVSSLVFVNPQLQDVLLEVMTVICLLSITFTAVLVLVEGFMFAHPRYRRFKLNWKKGRSALDAIREAFLAV